MFGRVTRRGLEVVVLVSVFWHGLLQIFDMDESDNRGTIDPNG
jgi:hypothetical protein